MRKNGNSGGVEWKKKMEGTSMNNVLVKKVNEKKKKQKNIACYRRYRSRSYSPLLEMNFVEAFRDTRNDNSERYLGSTW